MRTSSHGKSATRTQSGFALIALLALAALVAAFLIASSLNRTAADTSNDREQRSMDALRNAKAALIAYAANEQWQLYKALPKTPATDASVYFQPGALPCPDQDDDGDADCSGSNTASMIGRVPYRTLGIDDLRDASGERLWYALSHDFRKLRCVPPTPTPGCTRINSDTMGQLTVTGTAPATQVVAVLFAPGQALQGQNRDPANTVAHNNPLNYLEGPPNLSDPVNYVFTTAQPSSVFNDRVLVITQADLMAAVEPVVAARIQRDIAPLMQTYFTKWNAYPSAMPWSAGGPPAAQSAYLGVSNTTHGFMPLKNDATFAWTSASVTQLVGHPMQTGSPPPVVTSTSCSTSPSQVVCQVDYDDESRPSQRPVIMVQVFLGNADKVFADNPPGTSDPIDTSNFVMRDRSGALLSSAVGYGYWSFVAPNFPPSKSFVARPNGGALTYIGRLQPADGTQGRVFITVSLPSVASTNYLPIVSDSPGPPADTSSPPITNPTGAWFIANQWYRQTYYAVSPGFAPGGVPVGSSPACSALPSTPSCLKVNNLPAPVDNKQVILVLAGRSLNGTIRPSPTVTLADYLEGANLTAENNTTPYVYEHRAGAPTSINDRVVVVSP